jgi:glycosyltransferase involved in cell wall biosynthesis
VVSRLVPYKRIDIAIEACNQLKLPLKIVGTGREYEQLKRIAGPTIEFVQSLTDGELAKYYEHSRALLFPGNEDFGIVMAEAERFGKPVIAYAQGGAKEIVIPGKTGELFDNQTVGSLISVLETFDEKKYDVEEIYTQGQKFSAEQFRERFRTEIERLWSKHINTFTR